MNASGYVTIGLCVKIKKNFKNCKVNTHFDVSFMFLYSVISDD